MTIRRKFTVGRLAKGRYLVHGNHGDKFIVGRYDNDHDYDGWENPPANPPKFLWYIVDAYSYNQTDGHVGWHGTDLIDDHYLTKRDAVQYAIEVDFARHNPEHGPTWADLGPIQGPTLPVRHRAVRRLTTV